MQEKLRRFYTKHNVLSFIFVLLLIMTIGMSIKVITSYRPTISYYLNQDANPTKEEQEILDILTRRLSEDDYNNVIKKGADSAKNTQYLEIGKCIPRPRIISVKVNSNLVIHNSDKEPHNLALGINRFVTINPGETKRVLLDFIPYVPSLSPYGCDDSSGPVGALYVTAP